MRLRGFVFSIIIIVVFLGLLTLLLPSKVTVTKSVLIKAGAEAVTNEILHFCNWKDWYPAFQNEKIVINIDSSGSGTQKSVTIKEEHGKELSFYFTEIKKDTIQINVITSSSRNVNYQFILAPHSDAQTQLSWNVNLIMKWYPWEKLKGIFLDKISGPQFEAALVNFKKAVEKKAQ